MRTDLIASLKANQAAFGIELTDEHVNRLTGYCELVTEHNPLLHLVASCSPAEFATRHILESLTLLDHLPNGARFADVGTGAGLPAIPCLLVRDDLSARLIESKEKKTRFLETAVEALGMSQRVEVVNRQFAETDAGESHFVTCRALDRFTERLPALIRWAKRRPLLLFGGNSLADALATIGAGFEQKLMPLSEQRFLFIVKPKAAVTGHRASSPYSRRRR
ncbi:MAG: class I SAM-dependent methyltransferase [Chloracidobacterium sp.]|nr:class I SAM-dependent methyltransferase [Chloracidobacterium sp.]